MISPPESPDGELDGLAEGELDGVGVGEEGGIYVSELTSTLQFAFFVCVCVETETAASFLPLVLYVLESRYVAPLRLSLPDHEYLYGGVPPDSATCQ